MISMPQIMSTMEDLAGLAVIAERTGEPAQPLGLVKKKLEEKWLNTISQ